MAILGLDGSPRLWKHAQKLPKINSNSTQEATSDTNSQEHSNTVSESESENKWDNDTFIAVLEDNQEPKVIIYDSPTQHQRYRICRALEFNTACRFLTIVLDHRDVIEKLSSSQLKIEYLYLLFTPYGAGGKMNDDIKPLILEYLRRNKTIRALDIKFDSSVDSNFMGELLDILSQKQRLFYLVLQGIEMQESASVLAKFIAKTENLLYLCLNIRLYDFDYSGIAQAFRINKSIRSLWLACWLLTGTHIQHFTDNLKFNNSLTTFSILNSRKDPSIIEPLKEMFRYATTLESIILDRSNEELQGNTIDYYSLLPILSKNPCIQNIDYYLYDGEATNDFYELIKRNRNIQLQWDEIMKSVLVERSKIMLLDAFLPKEILLILVNINLKAPVLQQGIVAKVLVDRSLLGLVHCPFRFSALEVLRQCHSLSKDTDIQSSKTNQKEIKKAIESPYLPLYFPRAKDPFYYPNEEQRKSRAGF